MLDPCLRSRAPCQLLLTEIAALWRRICALSWGNALSGEELMSNRNRIALTWKSKAKQSLLAVADRIDEVCGTKSVTEPPRALSMHYGGGNFYDTAFEFFRILLDHANLTRDSRILDVGCGAGRIATPLQYYLSSGGSYDGLDIMPMGIEHCRRNVTPLFPNFRFQRIDVFNSYYNPEGTSKPADYTFPFQDEQFDVVLSTSLMTHLTPESAERYVSETARVLRPGGTALHTFFALDDVSRAAMHRGEAAMSFPYPVEDYFTRDARFPEEAIAMPKERIGAMFERVNLAPEFLHGKWARPDGVSFQDIVLGRKTA
jgi:SAM-dependent methyltransferase